MEKFTVVQRTTYNKILPLVLSKGWGGLSLTTLQTVVGGIYIRGPFRLTILWGFVSRLRLSI